MPLKYVIGDATRPQGDGTKIIVHVCNDVGAWGAGFVLAISKRWKRPEEAYRSWFQESGAEHFKTLLGAVELVPVEADIIVANLVGQVGLRKELDGTPPIRYDALASGFTSIARYAAGKSLSVHAPRLGCGLAGGDWDRVEALLEEHLVAKGVPVTIYDLP